MYVLAIQISPLSIHRNYKVKPITDDTKIKLPIFLGIPTAAPEKLRHLFENQLVTLNDVRMADKKKEDENHSVS